ncbi:MAG: YopT-type cysteine protease domain-containing protein, partial [Bryobacteraceae bacterium]
SGPDGHAICAQVNINAGITFFDPNYGEFFFERIGTGTPRDHSPKTFLVWMPHFWTKSNYNQVFGGGLYIASFYHA